MIEVAKNICPLIVTHNFQIIQEDFTAIDYQDEISKIETLQMVSLAAFFVYFFLSIRLGKGTWNIMKKWLFVISLLITKIAVPIAILYVAWKPLFTIMQLQPYFIVICAFEATKPLVMVINFNYFRRLSMTTLNKHYLNWERWKQVIFGINAPKDFNKREQLKKLKFVAWTTKQKHMELENFILPLTDKSSSKLQLDDSINSLLFVASLNLDGERLESVPDSFTNKNEMDRTKQ